MLDPIRKAITIPPGFDRLPTREEAIATLAQAHAQRSDREGGGQCPPPAATELGIPVRFAEASLDTWAASTDPQRRVLEVLRRFAGNFAKARQLGSNLTFRGNVGAGKTTLACATVRAVRAAGFSARYTTLGKFFSGLRDGLSEGQSIGRIKAKAANPDLLALDEVGVGFASKAELVWLTELIDERYAAKRLTIVISNLGTAALTELVGERAADRLGENGVDLHFDWPSFRRRREGGATP